MLELKQSLPLIDRIPYIVSCIKDHDTFYKHNEEVLDIYEGNLLPYVQQLMQKTLDKRYYSMIEHRILPINFIQKIVDKLAKSYAEDPMRKCSEQEWLEDMVKKLDPSSAMSLGEEYSYLNRGYAIKPKLTNKGQIKLDTIPFDAFYVIADDQSDRLCPTVFVEFMGKTERQVIVKGKEETVLMDWYIGYTDTEIVGFDANGRHMEEIAQELGYKNPIGVIPFVYGNRSVSNIMPKQDTDFLKLAKILPLMLSDLNGALMFQCFTLIYGIDVEFNDAVMSPNAIWQLNSRAKSDKQASVGTLQPTVDTDKALTFFKTVLAMWLDSKGIDAGSIMQLDSQEVASGLSKAIDELDTTEARKKSIKKLAKEERDLFILLAKLNNYWLKLPESRDLKLKMVDEKKVEETIQIEFKEPTPKLDYTSEIANSVSMLDKGLSYREKEIKRLHPYISEEEIKLIFMEYGASYIAVGDPKVDEATDPDNPENNEEGVPNEGTEEEGSTEGEAPGEEASGEAEGEG